LKIFIFGSDSIFIYFNYPDYLFGNVLCLPLAISQKNCEVWFREAYTSLSCRDKTKIVFEQCRHLSFMVASDQGETETFLRSQLDLVHHLLLLEYGETLYGKNKIRVGYFQSQEHQARITNLINVACHMADHKQSFLVQAVEFLLPNTNQKMDRDILSILSKNATSNTCHILLFVGTKQLAHFPKNKTFNLDPQDIFLLILFYMSYYNKGMEYYSHIYDDSTGSSGYNTPAEVSSDDDKSEAKYDNPIDIDEIYNLLLKGIPKGESHLAIEIIQIVLKQLDNNLEINGQFSDDFYKFLISQNMISENEEAMIDINLIFNIYEQTKMMTEETRKQKGHLSSSHCIQILKQVIDLANNPKGSASLSGSSKSQDNIDTPIYKELHFQTSGGLGSYWTYISQIYTPTSQNMSPITLVIISKDMQGTEAEKNQLDLAEKRIKNALSNYFEYFVCVENTISMITYVNQLPGLVHFILVDRTENRVFAPAITPMFGPNSKLSKNKKAKREVLKLLKKSIWDLCYQSQEFLARGYFTMIMKCGNFQYYYNLWFETPSGIPLKILSPFGIDPKKPLNQQFYKHVQSRMENDFPNISGIRCYEIYALYIKFLPLKVIEQHSQTLISSLLKETRVNKS